MPPLAIGIGLAVGGVASLAGSAIAAGAARSAGEATLAAAKSEQEIAKERLNREIAERQRIEQNAIATAVKSPTEIAVIDRMTKTREELYSQQKLQLDKEYSILEAADPAIKEAGSQLVGLMKGEMTKMLDPITKQRSLQRSKLEAQLARTLGPGFRSSSAGIEALTKFDSATETIGFQTLQGAIDSATKVYSTGLAARASTRAGALDVAGKVSTIDQAIGTLEGNINTRRANASVSGTSQPVNFGAIQDAAKSVTNAAGAPYQGDMVAGQTVAGFGNTLLGLGTNLAGQNYGNQMLKDTLQGNGSSSLSVGSPTSWAMPEVKTPQYGDSFGSLMKGY